MNNNKKKKTIETRQNKNKELLLVQLRKMPILQIACERAGIARSTYYRWRDENNEFGKSADKAINEGDAFITDMAESQLISLVKDKHFPAIQLWLRQHHPKYMDKIELSGNLTVNNEPLTADQEALITKAIELSGINNEHYETN